MVVLSWQLSALESKTQPWSQRRCVMGVEPRRATLNKVWGKISIRRAAFFQRGRAFSPPHLDLKQKESLTVWQGCVIYFTITGARGFTAAPLRGETDKNRVVRTYWPGGGEVKGSERLDQPVMWDLAVQVGSSQQGDETKRRPQGWEQLSWIDFPQEA